MRELDELVTAGRLRVGALIVEGSNLEPRVLQRFQMVHGYTFFRLDEHDGRRHLTPEGWDALSPAGTIARLDRFASEHLGADKQTAKYSVSRHARLKDSKTGETYKPAGDGVSRLQLEDELWSIRAMRHVFRLKANLSLQSWVTVLNPILPHGWPPQWAMTLDPHVLETPSAVPRHLTNSPELRHSRRDVRESASSAPVNDAVNKTEAEVEGS